MSPGKLKSLKGIVPSFPQTQAKHPSKTRPAPKIIKLFVMLTMLLSLLGL
jgi:hypothetical protein